MATLEQIAGEIRALQAQADDQGTQEALYEGTAAYFVPWGWPDIVAVGAAMVGSGDQVRVTRFTLPITIEVATIMIRVTGSAANSTLGVGIYNHDGSSLLLSGTVASTSTGVKTITLSPAVVIGPGLFLFAWTNTSAAVTTSTITASADWNTIINNTNPHQGTAANSSAVGVLPPTTGAITGAAGINIPLTKFEGA